MLMWCCSNSPIGQLLFSTDRRSIQQSQNDKEDLYLYLPVCSSVQRIRVPSGDIHVGCVRNILAIHASNDFHSLLLDICILHSLYAVGLILSQCDEENVAGGVLGEESRTIQVLPGAKTNINTPANFCDSHGFSWLYLREISSGSGISIHYIFGVQIPERLIPCQEELQVSGHMESIQTNPLPFRKFG